ncbi:hypothetical protein C5748_22065 [Phyllobacterium phragmitis]|uniref:Transposase n=1 Tax=Phyllobacterium phragmitis TaxID=2670329 RepID=A0A2S9ILG6_9HYPH|nr:hypothetical protein [Phyllobacterium phragmitis]PRD41374.1 hypothetical protein C5748_22065 [Phyllobacterium phragmitis]
MSSLTPPEHEHSAAIEEAARWIATTPDHAKPRPIIRAIQERFGISAIEACYAIREANLIRARAA